MSMKRGNHMKKILSKLQKIEDFILFLTFVIMILGAFAQVLNRNIFKFGISWLEEISRYCMVYMALLATEAGLRDGSQISLTVLTDRLGGTARLLRALGADARVDGDSLIVRGSPELSGGTAETESDHRMAMAAAVAACACRGAVTVSAPGCVSKSYPGFWDDLSSLEADK